MTSRAWLVLVLLGTACSDRTPTPSESRALPRRGLSYHPAPHKPDIASTSDDRRSPKPPTVTLIEAGREPRRELRYRPVMGTSERIDMTLHMDMKITSEHKPEIAIDRPSLRLVLRCEVVDASNADRARYRFVVEKAEFVDPGNAPERVVARLREELTRLEGVVVTALVSARGVVEELEIKRRPGSDEYVEALSRTLLALAVPLPEQPVGSGARWTVRQTLHEDDITFVEETRFRLGESAPRASLRVEVERTAEKQVLAAQELTSLRGSGRGVRDVDLRWVAPRRSETDLVIATKTRAGGDPEVTVRTQLARTISMEN